MNNRNEKEKNIGIATAEYSRVKETPNKKRKDVYVLALIVFVAVFILVGFTVAKTQNDGVSLAASDGTATTLPDGLIEEGGTISGDVTNMVLDEGNPFYNAEDISKNAAGDIVITRYDGTVDVIDGSTMSFEKDEVNLDDIFGTAPASTDDMMNKAYEKANNAAFAENVGGGNNIVYANQDYSLKSGGDSGSKSGNKASSGGTSTAEASFCLTISDGTWKHLIINATGSVKISGSCSPSGDSSRSLFRMGWTTGTSGDPGSGWTSNFSGGATNSSKFNFVYFTRYTKKAGGGKNDTATASARVSGCNLSIRHSITTAPTFALNTTVSSWAQSRTVKVTATSKAGRPRYLSLSYRNTSNASTSNSATAGPSAGSVSCQTGSASVSAVTATAYNYANNASASTTYSASTLKIDTGGPGTPTMYFVASSGSTTQITSLTNASKLYLYFSVTDGGGTYGAASGIKTVSIKNTRNNTSFSLNRSTWSSSDGASYKTWYEVAGNLANGSWDVSVTDWVNKTYSKAGFYTFYWSDTVAPSIGNVTISASTTDATIGGVAWTNDNLIISFPVEDYAVGTTRDNAAINTVSIAYTLKNGASYTIADSAISKSGSYVYTKTCTFSKLKFDFETISSMTITVKDKAGNTGTKTCTATSNKPTIKGRLDTIAPQVQSYKLGSASNNSAMSGYVATDVTVQVTVKDFPISEGGYFGKSGKTFNNGSGIKCLYFFYDSACTKPLYIDGTSSNKKTVTSSAGVVTPQTVNVTIKHDTANSAFGGTIYIVAEDYVGNYSDGRNTPGSANSDGKNWGTAINSTGFTADGVYIYPGKTTTGTVKRDTFTPQVVVKNSSGTIIASTRSLSGTSRNYTFPWQNVQDQKITIDVYYGCSGGTLSVLKGSTNYVPSTTKAAYGTGTGSDYNFSGSATAGSGQAVSVSTTGGTSYSRGASFSTSVSLADVGETAYKIKFKSGTGKESAEITVTARIDRAAPTVTLKGFSESVISQSSQLTSLISQDVFLNSSKWIYPNNPASGYYAVFEVSDAHSGVLLMNDSGALSNGTQKYGVNGTGSEQKTSSYAKAYEKIDNSKVNGSSYVNAGYRFEFKYTNDVGQTYSYEVTGYAKSVSGVGNLVQVQMFNTDKLKTLTSGSTPFYNSTTKEWNVSTGTYLRYKLGVSDFIGNIGYANLTDTRRPKNELAGTAGSNTAEWGDRVLRYYVDPFGINIVSVAFYQAKSSNWDDNWIRNSTASAVGTAYTMKSNRNDKDGWAKYYVFAEVKLATGLSPFEVDYRYQNMANNYNSSGEAINDKSYDALSPGDSSAGGYILYNGKTAWVVFSNSSTKDIQVGIGAKSSSYKTNGTQLPAVSKAGDGSGRYYVRQDISNPMIQSVFLSFANSYANAKQNKLLTFTAITANPQTYNYSFELNVGESPAYVSGKSYIFTDKNVYVYIKVTDQPGSLMGSGIDTVKFGGNSCERAATEGSSEYYVTKTTYGYSSIGTSGASAYSIQVTDKQQNACSASYGHSDKKGNRVLPVVDPNNPYISLTKTNESGYLVSAGITDLDENSASHTVYRFKGTSIKNNLFNATLSFRVGISGLTVYMRRTSYSASEPISGFNYYKPGYAMPADYDYSADGWGYYNGEQWIPYGGAATPYVKVYGESATGKQSGEITLKFELTSCKERFEVIAVSGTGKYYIIEIGPLFIDSQAPVIHSGMTVFTVESAGDNAVASAVDYNALQRIWTNTVSQQYTNGSVYIYYYITDPASGVADSSVLKGTEQLEKITLRNVPVWTVNGVATTVRLLDGETPSTGKLGNSGGLLTINGFAAYTLDSKAERIAYSAGMKVGYTTADIVCYRYKVTSRNEITVSAKDVAGNGPTNSTPYVVSIDKTDVTVALKARTEDSDTAYAGYTGDKYTNKDVYLRWQAGYGASGFGGFDYTITDMLSGGSVTPTYHIAIPQFNNVSGNIVMTYVENSTGATKTKTLGSWTDGFAVKAQQSAGVYYWYVKGSNTSVAVNSSYYAGGNIGALTSVNWQVYAGYLYCFLSIPKSAGNRYDRYAVTSYNTVTNDYAVGEVRPSATATFDVKIDVDAPVIDLNSGNIAELADASRWHSLAKSLRVNVYDALSGLAKTSQNLDATTTLENVRVECALSGSNVITGELIRDEDGLYRAYNIIKNGNYYERAGLFYIENYANYTIRAVDEAGNVATYTFKPQIDAEETTVESVTMFKADGTSYSYELSSISVGWVADIASTKVNWADDYVYALITVRYGRSGFILQYRDGTKDSSLDGAGQWKTISSSAYTVQSTVAVSESVKRTTLKYEIGKLADYTYAYYRFRAISNAQNTELNYYKSYTNSSRYRGQESANGDYISIELESYEASDVRYAGQNGKATVDLGESRKTGLIAIDKSAPDVGISLVKADGYTANGSTNYVSYGNKVNDSTWKVADGQWSKEEVVMTLALSSGSLFASGNVIYYRSSIDGKTWSDWVLVNPANGKLYTKNSEGVWKESGLATGIAVNGGSGGKVRTHDNDSSTIMSYYANLLDYTISDSRNNVLYEFYAESGAGKTSDVCKFGTVEGAKVYGIKIDTNKSEVQSAAAATFALFAADAEQDALAAEYNRQFASNGYLTGESAVYTKRNTVIVRLQIQKVGYSGVRINLTEGGVTTVLDTITYEQFIEEGGNVVYRYYRITGNGETVQRLQLESIAGRLSDAQNVYVRIDNTTPIVYVSSINGTKATNWGWTTKNLYSSDATYWYTSAVEIAFGIGVIENDAYDGQSPYSGYTLEYSVNNNGVWIPLNENRLVLEGIKVVEGYTYGFRITSGAGMTYRLGGDIRNNQDAITYNANNLKGEIYAADGVDPITAHVISGGTGDYDDGSYEYRFSVDSNDYYYDYFGRVDLGTTVAGARAYDTRTGEFTDYVTKVSDEGGNYSLTSSTSFKRGDVMELTYFAKYNGTDSGAAHNYFQNVTVSTAGERGYYYNVSGDILGEIKETGLKDFNAEFGVAPQADGKTLEKSGAIRVQFEGNNIIIVSYFIAEVEVSYGKDKFYLQSESGEFKTTGTATYAYADGSIARVRDVSLSYVYYGYFDNTVTEPDDIGAYYVLSSVTPSTGSFRVTDDTERKDFVLKYFTMESDDDNLFDVNDARDFGYVDGNYFDLASDGTVDENVKSYLDSDYVLNADITATRGLVGTYRGTFDGNNRCITTLGGTINGNYGLFEAVSGTVKNVSVTPDRKLIVSATGEVEIGLVTRKLLVGGTVENVSVVADVELHNFPSGSKFGGIAAYSAGGNFGGASSLFTDVRITNNGRAMSDVYVGAVAGYIANGTKFSGVYAFGEIEIYNSTGVGAGMLYGGADGGTYAVTAVSYFENNVFINGSTVSGASNVTDGVTLSGSCSGDDYQSFVVFGEAPVVGGIAIDEEILTRLYSDFGYVYDENAVYGLGTPDKPLEIADYNQVLAINGYMNLDFVFAIGTDEIDMSDYDCTLAITKVFNGTLSAKQPSSGTRYVRFVNFAGNTSVYDKNSFGLFGQLNGTVRDIAFTDIDLDFDYVGEGALTAGIVAARAYENAVVKNVLFIGTETVRAEGKVAEVGGVVGYSRGALVTDVFSINNIAVTAGKVTLGGIAAVSEGITLPDSAGSVFLLGRTEAYGASLTVGAAIGSVVTGSTVSGGAKVFAIKDNVYSGENVLSEKPVGSTNEVYGIQTVNFSYDPMRTASFASAPGSVFNLVFGSYYPIAGDGSSLSPFVITNEKDFGYINLALYAEYRIDNDITFTDFHTIGEGLVFSGVLKGSTGDDISAEGGRIIGLMNVTAPLVYRNSGKINDLSVNVEYSATVKSGEVFRYGAIAVISDGEIKNVTVSGNVTITSATQDNEIYVSGFVAESRGGVVDAEISKLQNSISALNITVTGGGTAYIGGYAGIVTRGAPKFSYGIATGTITVTGVRKTYAGLLVGVSHGDCEWVLGEAASIDYTYSITVNGTEIPKYDEVTGEPLTDNFCGLVFE